MFAQECSNDDLGCYGKVRFAFLAFIWEDFMELVEDFEAKVNKYN